MSDSPGTRDVDRPVRVGLVGCGWIVERCHAPVMATVDAVDVVAVADPSEGRADIVAEMLGLEPNCRYADFHELLARDDIDLISVATPPATHREIVEAAALRAVHVICEKPLATNLADCDAMVAACAATEVKLAMYHNYLFMHAPAKLRTLIASGAIGEVETTHISGLALRPWVGNEAYKPGWRFALEQGGGGAFMDVGPHAMYLTEMLHSSRVSAVTAAMHYDAPGIDAVALCEVVLESGGMGSIQVGWRHGGAALEVYGSTGHLSVVFDECGGYFGGPTRAIRHFAENEPTRTYTLPLDYAVAEPQLFRDLASEITGNTGAYPAFGEHGRRCIEATLAAYSADARRTWVELPISSEESLYQRGVSALV